MNNRRVWGFVLIAVALVMMIFFALFHPKALVIGTGPATLLVVFGVTMASGRWPTPQQK
ncbi:hypothetical protein [Deinococcus alpinitundrae]|uniref:hypothetical protein n=1 Tax=Deinococcus alpinitundrae TaxID=468913 RepID=UPI0013797620|nr:hypothetical protein [Deinococcus alpinitundrae]